MARNPTRKNLLTFNAALSVLPFCLLFCGCAVLPWKNASKPVEAQKGGYATGAGASIVQPVNSGEKSTQKATRKTWYHSSRNPSSAKLTSQNGVEEEIPVIDAVPVYQEETTETTLGAHQDLAGIVSEAFKYLGKSSLLLWFGLVASMGGIYMEARHAGRKEADGTPDDYKIFWITTIITGITWVILGYNGGSEFWLALGIIPLGIWLSQQDGVMKLMRRLAGIP